MNPQFQEIGQAFVEHYYNLFQSDKTQLCTLYQDDSLLTFEGAQQQGQAAIAEKFRARKTSSICSASYSHTLPLCDVTHQSWTVSK